MKALHTARSIASAERGTALVMALLALVLLTAFGLTLSGLGMTEIAISSSWRDYSKDFYAAEAGLESGVVALRNLLATTPAPTSQQLNDIATAPTLTDTRLTFGAYTITLAAPAYQQTFATGPYKELFGIASLYRIRAQVDGGGGTRSDLSQTLQYTQVPLFQFGVFYGQGVDLEMAPGAPMTFNGRIHANSNIYIAAVAGGVPPTPGLGIDSYMTTAGGIYRTIKRDNAPNCNPCTPPNTPYPPSSYNKDYNDPYIKDAAGAYHALNFDSKYQSFPGTTWASQSAWVAQANATFQGKVKDNAMGVGQITPPIPELFFNPSNPDVVAHELIEMPQMGDSAALAAAKMYSQANVRIIDGVATGLTCGTVPSGAITTKAFYDAREGKTMTATELDVNSLRTNNCLPNAAVLYVASTNTSTNPAVRLVNGSQLPSGGMTVVSQNPVYVKGNYNSVNKAPAAILGDAVTVLSNQWSDANANSALNSRKATGATTVNAAFALGPSVESTQNQGNGQLENVIRFLEDWQSNNFNYSGSIIALWPAGDRPLDLARDLLPPADPRLVVRHHVQHDPAPGDADGHHHDEGALVAVVSSHAMTNDRGMSLVDVLLAVAITTIGLLAVVSLLSSGFSGVVVSGGQSKATSYARQKLEEVKNRCYNNGATCVDPTFPASTGNDTPEGGVTRSWAVAQVGATGQPNRLSRITVTVTWTSGDSGVGGGQQVILETMRAE